MKDAVTPTSGEAPLFEQSLQQKVDLRLAVSEDIVGEYPVYIRCREHNDKNRGNLAVYTDHLHCFVCGWHEPKTLQALAYLLKVTLREVIPLAPKYTNESLDAYRERAAQESRRDPLPDSLAVIYNEVLYTRRSHRLGWLKARGLMKGYINAFSLGHDGTRFIIPIFDRQKRLVALRFRRDDMYCDENTPKYCGLKGRNGQYLFPEDWVADTEPETLVVCEGELDAIRLWQEGIPAVTVTNGAGQVRKLPAMVREAFPSVRRLILATDMDEAGIAAAIGHTNEQGKFIPGTQQAAEELGFTVERVTWSQGKDITEALQLGALDSRALKEACSE